MLIFSHSTTCNGKFSHRSDNWLDHDCFHLALAGVALLADESTHEVRALLVAPIFQRFTAFTPLLP